MVEYVLQDSSAQLLLLHRKIVLRAHTLMETAINLKLSVTYVQTAMFVQLLAKVTIICSQHHVRQVNGAVLEFHQTQALLFVMQGINVQLDQRCKFLVLLVNTIQVLVLHNLHALLVMQETIASFGTPFPQDRPHKN